MWEIALYFKYFTWSLLKHKYLWTNILEERKSSNLEYHRHLITIAMIHRYSILLSSYLKVNLQWFPIKHNEFNWNRAVFFRTHHKIQFEWATISNWKTKEIDVFFFFSLIIIYFTVCWYFYLRWMLDSELRLTVNSVDVMIRCSCSFSCRWLIFSFALFVYLE